jgi:outer membrane protein assembly factor BamE (lipoprotein component of BamABCDE complex)
MNARLHSPRTALSFFLSLLAVLAMSCASVGNNFDESKISQIKKGETTEADLVAMFGEPQNRSVNSDSGLTLTWIYSEAKVKGESFIPYAGPFLGGTRSKSKTLSVMLADNKVTTYTYSGGGTETRNMTQDTPKN